MKPFSHRNTDRWQAPPEIDWRRVLFLSVAGFGLVTVLFFALTLARSVNGS